MSAATKSRASPSDLDRSELVVGDADALDDRIWFDEHPDRRFHARVGAGGVWLIRRRPQSAVWDALLRVFSRTIALPSSDGDKDIAALWYETAYPSWSRENAQKAAREAVNP